VSDGTASDIDPRFDPRFQRGYVPDAAAPTSEPTPPQPAPPAASAPAPAPALDPDVDAAADPAAAFLGLLAHAQAERLARSDRESVDGDPVDGEPAEHDSTEGERAAVPQPDAEPMVDVSPVRWFWIALAACLVFIVVGVAIFWNAATDRSMFMGGASGLEGAFTQFSMALAPGLVQAGALGAVAVLVTWAVTGRRSRRGAE
jgi:hypothetical protein